MKRNWLKRLERHRVVVHTRDDQSIRGVVAGVHADCVVLEAAEYLGKDSEAVELDGRAVILRDNTAWVQLFEVTA